MDIDNGTMDDLRALAGVPLAHADVGAALQEICAIASRAVPGADGASLTTFSATGPEAAASSDAWSARLDEMQYQEHEGPCLDSGRTGTVFRVRDVRNETRWPSYLPRASAEGVRSIVAIPMTVEAKTIGALNVYSRTVDAFDAEAASLAEVIAGHASLAALVATALHGHRSLAEQLREAMGSRAVIEQAKGIVMATDRKGPDAAFAELLRRSSHENRKVREIAEELVRQHSD